MDLKGKEKPRCEWKNCDKVALGVAQMWKDGKPAFVAFCPEHYKILRMGGKAELDGKKKV